MHTTYRNNDEFIIIILTKLLPSKFYFIKFAFITLIKHTKQLKFLVNDLESVCLCVSVFIKIILLKFNEWDLCSWRLYNNIKPKTRETANCHIVFTKFQWRREKKPKTKQNPDDEGAYIPFTQFTKAIIGLSATNIRKFLINLADRVV